MADKLHEQKIARRKIIAAFKKLKLAKRDIADNLKAAYPVGSVVHYAHGAQIREVLVIDHISNSRRLIVKSMTARKPVEYQLDVWEVLYQEVKDFEW
jgi:hypothetical protein